MKIGALSMSLRQPLPETIIAYRQMGLEGIQLEVTPEILSAFPDRLLQLRHMCREHGLEISALCGDIGRTHFSIENQYRDRVALHCRVVDVAVHLGTKVVTTHIGVIPEDKNDPVYAMMAKSIRMAAEYSAAHGVVFAIETGPETAEILRAFIEDVDSAGLGVNLDPANLRMVSCVEPDHAVKVLGKYIVHTHAKDGINLQPGSAAANYGIFEPDGTKRKFAEQPAKFKEVPLGQGQVDWDKYLAALKSVGFDGFLTIERECGDSPAEDIQLAVDFLRNKLI